MYKGKKYEYDKEGLEKYHKQKRIDRAKATQMQNLNLSPAEKKAKEEMEKKKKRKLKKNGGPLSKG